jgi:RHS repeat-associated protein
MPVGAKRSHCPGLSGGKHNTKKESLSITHKYYSAGAQSVALRVDGVLKYTLGDQLGSTNLTTDATGLVTSELRYTAFGETRYTNGKTPTNYRYTGQLQQPEIGLYYYNARWYDSALGRFTQPDTTVPGAENSKSYDRYSYVLNNPIRYNDPSGHVWGCIGANLDHCSDDGTGKTSGMVANGASASSQKSVVEVWSGSGASIYFSNTVERQLPLYNDKNVIPINYPGYDPEGDPNGEPGKPRMAASAQDKALNNSVIMICYSSGTEACLMHARWRIQNGHDVQAVALLGPTFYSFNEGGRSGSLLEEFGEADGKDDFDNWADYTHYLLKNGVDVLVVDDANKFPEISGFDKNAGTPGIFYYDNTHVGTHWTSPNYQNPGYGAGSNDRLDTKEFIYNWISNPVGN